MRWFMVLALAVAAGGCGQRGPLYLRDNPPPGVKPVPDYKPVPYPKNAPTDAPSNAPQGSQRDGALEK